MRCCRLVVALALAACSSVLRASGLRYREALASESRLAGEGVWVAISRDPVTGRLRAGSHNRNNSAALAW